MMNAYQRPLFRQAGGPAGIEALPPPPPAGVAALPQQDPQAMVEAAGQMASSEMESVGQDYVLEMVNSLDNAENFKTVIDALRGNKLPLDERFAELAEYVGEDDAEKTPESVLAMVQPVIMMTEEGNVDSGIGQLMQSLTGEVDMVTEEGDLTDMGQGVGSLMVANQEAPPPQRFADGGAVQHFANGSPFGVTSVFDRMPQGFRQHAETFSPNLQFEQNLKPFYEQRKDLYMGILDPEKERQMTQSQIMFDIAQAGLNLAGGVDPRTGQSMTQLPIASQIATAAGGLPGQISSRLANQRQSEQAAKLAALQAAESQLTARESVTANERGAYMQALRDAGLNDAQIEAQLTAVGMREAGATERTVLGEEGATQRTILGEEGATQRTILGEEGATQRTILGEEGATARQERMFEDREVRDHRLAEINREQTVLEGDQSRATLGRQYELMNERDELLFQNLKEEIEARADAAKSVFAANTEVDHGFALIRQTQSENFQTDYRNADRNHARWVANQNFEREDEALDIQRDAQQLRQDIFEDAQERGLSTGGWTDWWDSDARNAAEARERYTRQLEELTLRAQEVDIDGVGFAQELNRYVQLGELSLRNRAQSLRETEFAYGVMVNQLMPAAREEYSRNQMYQLLADPNVINAYKAGAPMPDVELALSQVFKWTRDPETGEMTQSELPPGWEAAFRQREGLGFAVPNVGKRSLFFNADGGEIKKMQGGGDPRGAYEPITGTYLPFRDRREDEPVPIESPLITATGEGLDITAAVGSDAALMNIFNTASEAVTGILGGPGLVLGEHYQEAARALDSFNQVALTRALGSIAGRENKELQERLARLEVPAASFVYGDRKALAQFQTSSRVMDFAIREQEAALRGPSLTRTERNKASKDLAALQGIKLEYDRLADAFSRKIEGETADISTRLDAFFN
jgi:hypothetical protein